MSLCRTETHTPEKDIARKRRLVWMKPLKFISINQREKMSSLFTHFPVNKASSGNVTNGMEEMEGRFVYKEEKWKIICNFSKYVQVRS